MNSRAVGRLRSVPSRLVNQLSVTAHHVVSARLAAVGAHRYHYSVLAALAEAGSVSQAEVGRLCGLDRSDVTATVAELAARGHVERGPDPLDRRRNAVHLSDSGRERLEELERLVASAQDELLEPLTPAERETLTTLLTRLVDHHTP